MNFLEEPTFKGGTDVRVYRTEMPSEKAEFAMRLMDHLAIAAATTDGEDSSGRQKCRLLTPEEVTVRAVAITEAAWVEFRTRQWILDLPAPSIN